MNMFSLPTKSSDLEGKINQRIRMIKALITTKFDLVEAIDISLCDPNALPQVEMSGRVLHEIYRLVMKDLTHFILLDSLTDKDLTEEEYNAFYSESG